MKRNLQMIERVGKNLDEALAGVDGYLQNWAHVPQSFTTEKELRAFSAKLREMRESLTRGEAVPIIGLWRIMETWPFKNELRQKIVEAELGYERISKAKPNSGGK